MKKLITILFFLPFLVSAHTMTANGNAQIDTAQKKFGSASGLFDGTGDSVTAPASTDFDLGAAGSGDFTISMWIRFNTRTADHVFIATTDAFSENTGWGIYYSTGGGTLNFWAGDGPTATLSWSVTADGVWRHVVVARSGGTITAYIDGTSLGTYADENMSSQSKTLYIGAYAGGAGFDGWIDEVTIQKGTARWTSNFTSPTEEDDQCVLANVKLLLHMNGTDASTTFTDDSTTACGGGTPAYLMSPILINGDD